jgi:hypothetical protein
MPLAKSGLSHYRFRLALRSHNSSHKRQEAMPRRTWNLVDFWCAGMGGRTASVAGASIVASPPAAIASGVDHDDHEGAWPWAWSRLPQRLRLKLRCGKIQRIGRRIDTHPRRPTAQRSRTSNFVFDRSGRAADEKQGAASTHLASRRANVALHAGVATKGHSWFCGRWSRSGPTSHLGKLNDDLDIVGLPFEGLFEILRFFAARDQAAEPLAVSASEEISGLIPVPFIGVHATDNDVVL